MDSSAQKVTSVIDESELQLEIIGMTCASCVHHVEQALQKVPGVDGAEVNLALESARVRFQSTQAGSLDFVRAISNAGYQVRTESRVFTMAGLDEAPARARAERAVNAIAGVIQGVVNGAQSTLTVERVRGVAEDEVLMEALRGAGFVPTLMTAEEKDPRLQEARSARRRVALALIFTLPLWAAMLRMFFGLGPQWVVNPWLELVVASVVQWGPGFSFTRRAWLNVRHGNANMDVLIATGTLAAWSVSVYGVFAHAPLYFDTSATVITLILVGKYLEAAAKGKTSEAIQQLLALTPKTTRLVTLDGSIEEVAVDAVVVGQTLEIRSGDRIPVDGRVTSGTAVVDESLLTGEAEVKTKAVSDTVWAGTVQRGTRAFRMEATRVGRETTLAQVVKVVEEAQSAKAPVQRFVDRVANVFVPAVLAVAALTFLGWGLTTGDYRMALLRAVAVLVVACPCSLGLATPTAVMVGSGLGARLGVLFRNGEALERVSRVDVVALDKTGTLTEGHPEVSNLTILKGAPRERVLGLAASLEQTANHPLGQAIMRAVSSVDPIVLEDVYAEEGQGMVGFIDGSPVLLGNEGLLDGFGFSVPREAALRLQTDQEDGRTVVWLAEGEDVLAAFVIADRIRGDARRTVEALKHLGISTMMLTGDRRATAERVAREVGIDTVHAELSPVEKAQWIEREEAASHHVAMVGDGVNDAPALARAYVGMAVAGGSDVAAETAEVTLMRPEVGAVLEALAVGAKTMAKIRQNLFWALGYNVVMIPLAVIGILPPMLAGAFMAMSSVTVVSNSLLLRYSVRRV